MSNRGERAAQQSQPRKLYKPQRAELSREVVVTYTTECDLTPQSATGTSDFSAGE